MTYGYDSREARVTWWVTRANTAEAMVLGHIGLALTGDCTATTQEQGATLTDLRKRHAVLVPATEFVAA